MRIFKKDYEIISKNTLMARPILMERKAELDKLEREEKTCKNSFRRQCIAQEYERKLAEYKKLDELV